MEGSRMRDVLARATSRFGDARRRQAHPQSGPKLAPIAADRAPIEVQGLLKATRPTLRMTLLGGANDSRG